MGNVSWKVYFQVLGFQGAFSFSERYLWSREQLTLASRKEDKLQLQIFRSLVILLLRILFCYPTENRAKHKILGNNCLITHVHCLLFSNSSLFTNNIYINNYFSSPSGFRVNSAEWDIDSEAMRARGIIVLVKSNYLIKNIETKQL